MQCKQTHYKLLVKLFALEQQQIQVIIALMSSFHRFLVLTVYIYKVGISVCLPVCLIGCPSINYEPLDRFASTFKRGKPREYPYLLKFQVGSADFCLENSRHSCRASKLVINKQEIITGAMIILNSKRFFWEKNNIMREDLLGGRVDNICP